MSWCGLQGTGERARPHRAGGPGAGAGWRGAGGCAVSGQKVQSGHRLQGAAGTTGPHRHILAFCPWQVGATVRIEHRSSRLCGQYPSWNSLPPLAGQTAEASEDPPPWVIICFWYGSVCPQGLSGYRADFQKWGQGGDMCWAGPRSAGNPGGPNKPWPWGEGCVFRRGAG